MKKNKKSKVLRRHSKHPKRENTVTNCKLIIKKKKKIRQIYTFIFLDLTVKSLLRLSK